LTEVDPLFTPSVAVAVALPPSGSPNGSGNAAVKLPRALVTPAPLKTWPPTVTSTLALAAKPVPWIRAVCPEITGLGSALTNGSTRKVLVTKVPPESSRIVAVPAVDSMGEGNETFSEPSELETMLPIGTGALPAIGSMKKAVTRLLPGKLVGVAFRVSRVEGTPVGGVTVSCRSGTTIVGSGVPGSGV